ncbi:hypothetical protein JET76_01155 [Pseudomonas putida]|uniref:Uncharacterized protein n=1 Tax=Pseudomonas putida TaxID=303 RepID=A0A7W2KYY5_PSEPU|nr:MULTISPECIES: hypothetical protein [Pseudomonas]MBA6115325.1 hypothetical protein [Pseudomonas putida]MBI6939940.1 hypothetical protein [Pseudomonas putida]MBI6956090.1 hypothetical protein [Pseudomonas putida]MCZ9639507.1 hypothetical protein [Pseudomonas putida]MEC4878090.1 hypothetical protein [Pseudomonas sp. NC26]
MNIPVPRIVLLGLFAFAAMGSASATQMKASPPVHASELSALQAPDKVAATPWPNLARGAAQQPGTLLAHDDRYRHDGRWHDRRDDWRRENWRREQWRREQAWREAERRRDWQRHHDRALHHRYEANHHDYRR